VSHYVTVLASGSDEFAVAFPTLVSPVAAALLAPAVPYAVIVKNVSNQPLRGVGVTFGALRGGVFRHRTSYASLTLDQAQTNQAPGGYQLFFASGALSDAAQWGKMPARLSVSDMVTELNTYPIIASVEWVIDEKGHMVGPDRFHIYDQLSREQQARAALAKNLTASADPIATLQAAANIQPGPRVSLFERDFYNEQLRRDALYLLRRSDIAKEVRSYVSRANREIVISK
jgi:hypothetical protein